MSCVKSQWACIMRPYHLINWWDMKPFPVVRMLQLVRVFEHITSLSLEIENADAPLKPESRDILHGHFRNLVDECEDCSLTNSADQFARIAREIESGASWRKVRSLLPDSINRIEDECNRHTVLFIEPAHAKYFSDAFFFDSSDATVPKVSLAFPSAAEDIGEAGKSLACGRSTACVMHLARVLERGLKALANAVGVTPKNDWGKYLSEIDSELQKRFKSSGARTRDEQFYSEVHVTFDAVRRAWRNPTMHVEKTYTVERAEEILIAIRSFMRHLATTLSE